MGKAKERKIGETYRPTVTVLKQRDGVPTKVKIGEFEYALISKTYINGSKNKVGENK